MLQCPGAHLFSGIRDTVGIDEPTDSQNDFNVLTKCTTCLSERHELGVAAPDVSERFVHLQEPRKLTKTFMTLLVDIVQRLDLSIDAIESLHG